MATQIGDLRMVQKLISQQFEEIPSHHHHHQQQQQQKQKQQQQQLRQELQPHQTQQKSQKQPRQINENQIKLKQQQRSSVSTTPSKTSPRRRISRQVVMSSLGLIPLVDQKNERGMSPLHIAAATGNMCVMKFVASF